MLQKKDVNIYYSNSIFIVINYKWITSLYYGEAIFGLTLRIH
jgi:hypothetical protein